MEKEYTIEELKALVKESLGEMNLERDELSMSDIDMPIQDKGVFSIMGDEEVEDDMSDLAKYRTMKGGDEFGDDASISPGYIDEDEMMEITMEEMMEMIREGVEDLHRKSLIENRLQQINDELNMINNPEAWEAARTEAKAQLAKKTIAWNNISTREQLMDENKGIEGDLLNECTPPNYDEYGVAVYLAGVMGVYIYFHKSSKSL